VAILGRWRFGAVASHCGCGGCVAVGSATTSAEATTRLASGGADLQAPSGPAMGQRAASGTAVAAASDARHEGGRAL
jgi:hypothetical protein